mmetsp:Transcript_56516/g.68005  ORF Transcript_56516/g.68005 Transcript_56516/m.68005 type:complete len:587 (+) Transcript_56516:221-1981(+)
MAHKSCHRSGLPGSMRPLLQLFVLVTFVDGFGIPLKMSAQPNAQQQPSTPHTSGSNKREIMFYNSLSRTKDVFEPIIPGKVSMYTCGPTVYDYAHVGNFRAFLTYDTIKRVLLYFGYNVDHICNLTDIDDKIIKRCNEQNISLMELTHKFANLFMDDLKALNIVPARAYPRATDHIPEMVQLIQDLKRNGLAYQSDEGSWYFNVAEKEGYGQQLVTLDLAGMKKRSGSETAGAIRGTDADEYDAEKVGVRDFALWKSHKPDFDREDATWDTEIGRGRPGWHLECSAMAKKYLGDTIDLHAGGVDLTFPHHENEIAQSEGSSGCRFCNCWMHNGFVNIGAKDEKMSKSKGNFLTLRTACPKPDDVRAYRYLVVSSYYRNPLSFTDAAMGAARGALKRIDALRTKLDGVLEDGGFISEDGVVDGVIAPVVTEQLEKFDRAIADDLAMPRAAACLFAVLKAAEGEFKRFAKETKNAEKDGDSAVTVEPLDLAGLATVNHALLKMDEVFGLFYEVPSPMKDDSNGSTNDAASLESDAAIPAEVMKLVSERIIAKDSKDWDLADSLRSQITQLGFAVKDLKDSDPIVSRIE